MSQATEVKIWNLWQSSRGMPRVLVREMINLIQSTIDEKLNFVESKGHKEWRQTTLAKIHSKNRCWRESFAILQRGHEILGLTLNNWPSHSFVGRIFQAIFHKNNMSRSLRFSFQIEFQNWGLIGEDEALVLESVISCEIYLSWACSRLNILNCLAILDCYNFLC